MNPNVFDFLRIVVGSVLGHGYVLLEPRVDLVETIAYAVVQ